MAADAAGRQPVVTHPSSQATFYDARAHMLGGGWRANGGKWLKPMEKAAARKSAKFANA
jgi:hypothetical protein